MFLASFPTGAFEANCYVVATGAGTECVVIDPGQGAAETVHEVVRDNALTPVGVLATHGHLDHIADAARLCRDWQVPCWIHPADRELLTEPLRGLPAEWEPMLVSLIGGTTLPAPPEVRSYGDTVALAGLEWTVLPAPGHSPGSVVLQLDLGDSPDSAASAVAFTGDVIFAGTIGRTDLPGGDPAVMAESLARLATVLPGDAVLLPGHGDRTTMATEAASNPHLPRTAAD